MTLIWIGVAAMVAAAIILLARKPSARALSARRLDRGASTGADASQRSGAVVRSPAADALPAAFAPRHRAAVSPSSTVGRDPVAAPTLAAPATDSPLGAPPAAACASGPPEGLATLRLIRADEVPEDHRRAYADTFRDIPRPPRLLHHLLSPDSVNASSSAQLVDLIAAEPLLAGRVLTIVNSPIYGLTSPMGSIGQAVTYLGLNAVRGLCLRYVLMAQFRPDGPERGKLLDAAWTASALASELTQQLAHRLGFDDRGSLVSAVVLSFLGRLAITATVSRGSLDTIAHGELLARTVAEQKVLGLAAAQIGRLLMREWGLPERIIDDATDIDAVLVTPPDGFSAARAARLGLCYLAARLGERLATDEAASLATFEADAEVAPEFFHFRRYLGLPELARVRQALRAPEIEAGVRRARAAMRQA